MLQSERDELSEFQPAGAADAWRRIFDAGFAGNLWEEFGDW